MVLLGLFVWREAHADAALLPLRIVVDRQRGAAYLAALFAIAGMFGAFLFLTYEFQVVMSFNPLQAGFAFLPMSAASFFAATFLATRLRSVPGFVLGTAGMVWLSQLHVQSSYVIGILPAELLLGFGTACVMVSAARQATSGVNVRDAGIASAALNSAQQIGASLGTAILNSVAATVTAAFLVADASAARTDALVHGYAAAALCGALLLVAGAAVVWVVSARRRLRPAWRFI